MKKLLLQLGVLLLALGIQAVQARPVRVEAVELELLAQNEALVPGKPALLGLRIRHDPHWHTYWRNPGDSGLPTTIRLGLPDGWIDRGIVWPAPERLFIGPLASYAFEGDLLLPIRIELPQDAQPGPIRIDGHAQWLMCREVCIPGEARLALDLVVAPQTRAGPHADLFAQAASRTPTHQLEINAAFADGRISLALPEKSARSAEFFPYEPGWLNASAPQALYAIGEGGADGHRLELVAADGLVQETLLKAGFDGRAMGVLRLDGKLLELRARLVSGPVSGGQLVSTASGKPDTRGEAGGSGGLGNGLSGAGSGGLSSLLQGQPGSHAGGSGAQSLTRSESAAASGVTGVSVNLLTALLFAFLGGMILNLMPCVFPVIGLKVLGFASHDTSSGHGRASARVGALAFTAGVIASFWVLAGLLLALRAAGEAAGWGFQLQSPWFVAAMALLFVLIALNFSGVYEIGLSMTRLGQADPVGSGRSGPLASFGSGALAVLVATPCTAPFMGSALGYTLGQPAPQVIAVFTALGLGMALPYLALGYFPRALAWLPRPGRWMESFRQFLAFPMFATAAWLGWVFGLQSGLNALLALSIGAVLIALAAWLFGRFVQSPVATHRGLAALLAAIAFAGGLWLAWPDSAPSAQQGAGTAAPATSAAGQSSAGTAEPAASWQAWSREKVDQAIGQGRPVFVDFTAAWCVSCQANKLLVLGRDPVQARMLALNVLRLRADWTNRDPQITAELERHGRTGVPLYLLYLPGEAQPRILPEILTSGLVLDALQAVR